MLIFSFYHRKAEVDERLKSRPDGPQASLVFTRIFTACFRRQAIRLGARFRITLAGVNAVFVLSTQPSFMMCSMGQMDRMLIQQANLLMEQYER